MPLSFYTAFIGTFLSIICLSYLAIREYNAGEAKTLSELGGKDFKTLQEFRIILWVCGTLFTITMLFFIAPKLQSTFMSIMWTITYICEILLGVFPAHKGRSATLHNWFAYTMSAGFLMTTLYFAVFLNGVYQAITWVILAVAFILALVAIKDRKRFLFYELAFIYLSHISICVATLAVSR